MNHQVLQPFPHQWSTHLGKATRRPSKGHPIRTLLNSRSTDLKIAVSSGMIICSGLLIYSWAQPSSSKPETRDTEATSKVTETEKQTQTASHPASKAVPERNSKPQWSNHRLDQLPNHLESMYNDLLKQAQTAASRDQLVDAVKTIAGIPKNSRHYEMAQQLQEDWSRELVRQATNSCRQAQVETAISMLDAIPPTSQLHDRVAELRQRWAQQAKQFDKAIAAKQVKDWEAAIAAIQSLEGSPMYHSLPVQDVLQQAMTKLYEPDAALVNIATADLPVETSEDLQAPDEALVQIAIADVASVQPTATELLSITSN